MAMAQSKQLRQFPWFEIFNITFLVLFSIAVIYPVWAQIITSLSPASEAGKPGIHLWVNKPTLASYEGIFANSTMAVAFFWSTLRVIVGCAISVTICFCMAYPLSRKTLWKRNFWMATLVITMFFGGGLIPTYLLVRDLGMLNTLWALVLPGSLVVFHVLMFRNYMMSLPEELNESAKMDGANDLRILWSIILPVCAPIIATVTLWTCVAQWNAWFDAMIYIQKPPIRILQEILRAMLTEGGQQGGLTTNLTEVQDALSFTPESIRAATLVVITMPIICTYPFLQRYFVKGVMMGSLKG